MNRSADSITALRVGLVGEFTDPVAQLLQDQPRLQGARFFEVVDPKSDADDVDLLFVLSLDDGLAHFTELCTIDKPCQLLIRRMRTVNERDAWEAGLRWLTQSLAKVDWPTLELVALTAEAAAEIAPLIDRNVEVLDPLPAITSARPALPIRRQDAVSTFAIDRPGGTREPRRLEWATFNWARLRRLARLLSPADDDPDMADLVAFANGAVHVAPARTAQADPFCVLSVVPNGVGLGHVTRMMAIARTLKERAGARVIFWSFSRAAEVMQSAGFEVILRQNAVHLDAHPPSWRMWETREFARAIQYFGADLVSNDGANIDPFVFDALRMPGCGACGMLWVRRGMLRADTDAKLLELEQQCDLVLEPGDLAVEYDRGPTRLRQAKLRGFSQRFVSRPVTLKPFLSTYSAREAKRKLKLGWGKHVLVSLGGAFGNWDALKRHLEHEAKSKRIGLVWAQSPLAAPPTDTDANTLVRRFYPLNRYLAAFDGVVTATGYNSFHELMMSYDGPVLFAPTNFVRLDDQVARASWASEQCWSDMVLSDKPHEHGPRIAAFMDQVAQGVRPVRAATEFGGAEIANAILSAGAPYTHGGRDRD